MLAAEAARDDADSDREVLHDNREAFEVFIGCQTQWRVGGMGTRTGLDYTAVEAFMRITQVRKRADVFGRVRLIELGALQAMSERAAAKAAQTRQ